MSGEQKVKFPTLFYETEVNNGAGGNDDFLLSLE